MRSKSSPCSCADPSVAPPMTAICIMANLRGLPGHQRHRQQTTCRSLLIGMVLSFAAPQVGAYDWLQVNGDPQHSGYNAIETTLGAGNVSSLALKYHAALPAIADGAPVFLDGVTTPGGVKDLLFIATKAGDLVALDVRTGAQVWIKQYPNTLPPASCPSGNPPCSTT